MNKAVHPRRSVLYMPGSNTRALEKGRTLAADALILDLEDAVTPAQKEEARSNVCRRGDGTASRFRIVGKRGDGTAARFHKCVRRGSVSSGFPLSWSF